MSSLIGFQTYASIFFGGGGVFRFQSEVTTNFSFIYMSICCRETASAPTNISGGNKKVGKNSFFFQLKKVYRPFFVVDTTKLVDFFPPALIKSTLYIKSNRSLMKWLKLCIADLFLTQIWKEKRSAGCLQSDVPPSLKWLGKLTIWRYHHIFSLPFLEFSRLNQWAKTASIFSLFSHCF